MVFVPVPVGFATEMAGQIKRRISEKNVPSCVATWHGWMKSMDSNDFFETVSKRPDLLPQYLDAAKEWHIVTTCLECFRFRSFRSFRFQMISDFYDFFRPPCPAGRKAKTRTWDARPVVSTIAVCRDDSDSHCKMPGGRHGRPWKRCLCPDCWLHWEAHSAQQEADRRWWSGQKALGMLTRQVVLLPTSVAGGM